MPEMKHNFTKGRMNKDLDERLVPKGEYRDALNIEVSTSEGSNMGALQTCLGNLVVSEPNDGSSIYPLTEQPSVVGKVNDARNNRIIYLVNKPVDENGKGEDLIISYNVETGVSEVVFRDIWQFEIDVTQTSNSSATFYVSDNHGIKPNMLLSKVGGTLNGTSLWPFQPTVKEISRSDDKVTVKNNDTTNSWTLGDRIRFNSKRVLNFKTSPTL